MKALTGQTQGPLLRAIVRQIHEIFGLASDAGRPLPCIIVESMECVDWASLTFIGQRHRFLLRVDLPAAPDANLVAKLAAILGAAEFVVPRQIVAEIALTRHSIGSETAARFPLSLSIEALTIDD